MKMYIAALLLAVGNSQAGAEALSLNGQWKFRFDPELVGENEHWFTTDTAEEQWTDVSVPHTWNVYEGSERYTGTAWYARTVEGPLVTDDRHIYL